MFESIRRRLKERFSADGKYYTILNDIFGIYPNNIELYKLALIHRSASLFMDDGTPINNERLEFLGDAVLESIVSDYLFVEYPDRNEGYLSQVRSKIVSRVTLNEIAVNMGLDKHIVVQYSNRHSQKHLYGDAFEAMVGAIYLDKGYDYVNRFIINDILRKHIDLDLIVERETDFKSRLMEWVQKRRREIVFDTVSSGGGAERPAFVCSVRVGGEVVGGGSGSTKKEAEQRAASEALERLRAAECATACNVVAES